MEEAISESTYALQQKNAELEKKIQYLETIIEVHHVTKFDENLHRFKLNIRTGLRQIVAELQAMEYDPANTERVDELISYLQDVIHELERFHYC
ncbi:hypothetical protein [Mitsuokella sp. oral taxon 131]|uniref:hypothetical protein n=1 Tax=Mitsuokella sp. oral taxon 131 TaxID=1321780 RepID=UPI0003AE16C8|nr:hypothetical protein [Mitsuokella sp. oral taxon 131]ERL03176.1 hypothetical protein HMPREF1985_02338 [Mitsuokella sp. oral taxon 131 str. W9106]